jgi:DNA mismatch repair protein MutS2
MLRVLIGRQGLRASTIVGVDKHTLDKLEFDHIRQLLARQAQCALGREMALRISPSRRAVQVRLWLEQAREFERYTAQQGLPPFGGIRDVRGLVKRAVPPAKLEPQEFSELAETLAGVNCVREYFAKLPPTAESITRLSTRLGDFSIIIERINWVIDARGQVRDDASERLLRLRREIEDVRIQVRNVFDRILRQSSVLKFLQYPNATFHADRMVLPLKAEQRGRIQGIVHRSSDSGQTLFVEPSEAVELNNRRINLLLEEQEEIGRILWELTHLVHLNQKEIMLTLETLAVIDLLSAKVRLARKYAMIFPVIDEGHRLSLRQARNPILMTLHEESGPDPAVPHSVVPIDVRLGDDFDIMMITGPNTGGKTATLKTVGLLCLMAQSGLPIPATHPSTVPVFEGVWIDVGDEQSLEQSLSTFSAHLARILDIVKRAKPGTLVLLDELGAGTDPDEGAAIGRAIVDQLISSGCRGMITTHLGALKAIGFDYPRVDNASVQFDLETLRPTYELRIGEPGNSSAIAIASRLGMPRKMVESARRHLAGRHRALQRAIAGTLDSRREAERARRDADSARQDAARATLMAIDLAKALESKKADYTSWVEKVIRLVPGDTVFVRKFERQGRVIRVRLEKQQATINLDQMEVDVPLADLRFDLADQRA